jgi:hypothetical protein
MPYEIHDTSHVEKRARERGFTVEEATLTVNFPDRILKTPPRRGNQGGMLWLFFRAFEDRLLVVVAEIKLNDCWIITGYWEPV